MHYALPGSVLAHVAVLGAGLLMVAWPQPDDAPAMQAVSVEVIAIASVSANQTSTIQSDATETLVSAGAEVLPPVVPETIEAMQHETLEPPAEPDAVEPPPPDLVEPTQAKPVEAIEVDPVETATAAPVTLVEVSRAERMDVAVLSAITPQSLQAGPVAPIMPQSISPPPVQALQQATLAPMQITDPNAAPVPHILTRPRPSEPTQRPRQQQAAAPPPRAAPKPPVQQQAQPRPSAPAGNGGQNQADSVAARPSAGQQGNAGSGGNAEVARYPSQVVAKLRRALRYPGGAGGAKGEVHVQFTVSAGGQPLGVRIVQSSGNAVIDQAGIDTVMRAAPFPSIPASANRNSWGFTVPLAFVRG